MNIFLWLVSVDGFPLDMNRLNFAILFLCHFL